MNDVPVKDNLGVWIEKELNRCVKEQDALTTKIRVSEALREGWRDREFMLKDMLRHYNEEQDQAQDQANTVTQTTVKLVQATPSNPPCRGKSVRCIETGDEFSSISKAAHAYDIPYKLLCDAIHDKIDSAGGFHWELV